MLDDREQIFGYVLERRLGEGPVGEVWEVLDPDGQPAVLKRVKRAFARRPELVQAFEAVRVAVADSIDHPYLARDLAVHADPASHSYAIVSEPSPGRALAAFDVSRAAQDGEGRVELARLLFLFEELGEALNWLHHAGRVHGNVKPANVIVQRGDFGLVPRVVDLGWSALPGLRADTPFVAPEQFAGHPPTPASDQWAFGTILTRLLTSKRPDRSFGALPEALIDTVQRCRSRDVRARFPSMREAVDTLRDARVAVERPGDSAPPRGGATEPEPPVPSARSLVPDTGDGSGDFEAYPQGPTHPSGPSLGPQARTEGEPPSSRVVAGWIAGVVVGVALAAAAAALWLEPVPESQGTQPAPERLPLR